MNLILNIKPFLMSAEYTISEDGKVIKTGLTTFTTAATDIENILQLFPKIDTIYLLGGSKNYASIIGDTIQESAITKYNHKVNIKYSL